MVRDGNDRVTITSGSRAVLRLPLMNSRRRIAACIEHEGLYEKLVHVVELVGSGRFVTMNWKIEVFSYSDMIYLKRSGFLMV